MIIIICNELCVYSISAEVIHVLAHVYTLYEGLNLANQKRRKLGVFDRKLEGNHFPFYCYFDKQ